jgi:multicomponent Na+:H+ antiporter subunit C
VNYLPYGVAAWIFCVGIYGAIISRNLIHLAMCLAVTQSSTYILLLTIGYRKHGTAPVFKGFVTVIALILALALDAHKDAGTVDPDELVGLHG